MPRASEANVPGITDDILRAVEVLEDQLEQVLGPRPAPPPPILRNVKAVVAEQMTTGDHVADAVATTMGSWRFIAIQSALLLVWVILNVVGWIKHWDPYPFILLNLALSFQAAYSAPIIMMRQNRLAPKDRIMAEEDYRVNHVADDEIRAIIAHLERQDRILLHILARLDRPLQAGWGPPQSSGPPPPPGRRRDPPRSESTRGAHPHLINAAEAPIPGPNRRRSRAAGRRLYPRPAGGWGNRHRP
jgi:uncharacterized membrane protein